MIRRVNRPLFRPAVAAIVACLFGLTAVVTTADAYTGPVESANARYVVATYQQLLGRDPDDASLDFYLGKVAAGGDTSRQMIAEALLYGPEASAREVDRAYRKILERPAEPGGRIYWTNHLQVYDVLDLRVLLFSSDEYFRRAGDTNQDWVRALYLDILGRNPETAGLRYWTAEADRGTERALIVAGFYLGRESLGRRTDDYYRLVLQRPASAVERAAGASVIAAEGERSLYARLWASDEVFEQFFDAVWSP